MSNKKDNGWKPTAIIFMIATIVLGFILVVTNLPENTKKSDNKYGNEIQQFCDEYHEKDVVNLGTRLCKFQFGEDYTFYDYKDEYNTGKNVDRIICSSKNIQKIDIN